MQRIGKGNRYKLAGKIVGGILVAAALVVSLCNPGAAAFFWITGIGCLVWASAPLDLFDEFSIGLTSISGKLRQKVAEVEERAREIKEVEARLARALMAVVLNPGGEHYMGGLGEEAEFKIFDVLCASNEAAPDPTLETDLKELKRLCALKLIYSLVGESSLSHGTGAVIEALRASNFAALPSVKELEELAKTDGIDAQGECPGLLTDYAAFLSSDKLPSDRTLKSLYRWRTRARRPSQVSGAGAKDE